MQVEHIKTFQPIKLQITFESKQELLALQEALKKAEAFPLTNLEIAIREITDRLGDSNA
jgi:hypothetical protein